MNESTSPSANPVSEITPDRSKSLLTMQLTIPPKLSRSSLKLSLLWKSCVPCPSKYHPHKY
ncbi:MAG: hypothetical protein IJS39_05540 [Synergistaceae bacterium]|nr:hypothetical protein [Synergistaceae bacterium]